MSVQVLLIEDAQALGAQIVEHLKRDGSKVIWWQEPRRGTGSWPHNKALS
jgi:DNA-binding response OmpR family regulator